MRSRCNRLLKSLLAVFASLAKQSDEVVARAQPVAIQLLQTLGIKSAISRFVTGWKNEIATPALSIPGKAQQKSLLAMM
jgi:hypothetical protein